MNSIFRLILLALVIIGCRKTSSVNDDSTDSLYGTDSENRSTEPVDDGTDSDTGELSTETASSSVDSETEDATCRSMPADIVFVFPSPEVCNSNYGNLGGETLIISQENENTFLLESSYREARCEKSDCQFLCREITLWEIDVDGEDEEGNSIGANITYSLELSGTYNSTDVLSVRALLRKTCSGQLCSGEEDCSADISELITW